MKRSWREKLDDQGLKVIEASAKLRRIRPPTTTQPSEISRWVAEQKAFYLANPHLEQKRKAKLHPTFVRLYLRAHPEIELNEQEMQGLFDREEFPQMRAEELELAQRIALFLEADQTRRIEAYEAAASAVIFLQQMFSSVLKKQLLGMNEADLSEFLVVVAQILEWLGGLLRGNITEPPGRVNVELAELADAILAHQTEPLTQVELYEALEAAGAELPEDPEAFRLWLHRARKRGLVKKFHLNKRKASTEPRRGTLF